MEIEASQNIVFDPEPRDCADGNRFQGNQVHLTTCDFAEALDAQNELDLGMDDNLLPESNGPRGAEQKKSKERYNLRKSLAWDSAFFTSAGVLDADELSNMLTGTDKVKRHALPGIQEDITASSESISTLKSNDLNLENLEEDLFVDIRASIQRSNKRMPEITNSTHKKVDADVDSPPISSSKNEDITSSAEKKNPKHLSKRNGNIEPIAISKSPALQKDGKQGSRKGIKPVISRSQVSNGPETVVSKTPAKQNVGKQGFSKAPRQDNSSSQMTSIAKIGEKNPIPNKTLKTITNSTSVTTVKQGSLGIGRSKAECGSSKLGAPATSTSKVVQPAKVPGGAGRVLPRPAVPSRPSSTTTNTMTRVQSTRSSTSSDSSTGLSSGAPSKSLAGRKNTGGSSNAVTGPPSSIPKTGSRVALRNKLPTSSTDSPRLRSKISTSVSPASSISDWSSISSSTASMVIPKLHNSRMSVDTSSSRSTDVDNMVSKSRNSSGDQKAGGHENREVNLAKKTPAAGTISTSMKPSGLRMPSPKIGYFDGVKSSPRTPNGNRPSQPGVRTVLPKNGAAVSSPSRIPNGKLKVSRAPATKPLSKTGSARVTSLMSSQEKSQDSINSSPVSLDVKNSSNLPLGIKIRATGGLCQTPKKVQVNDGVKQVVESGSISIDKVNWDDLNIPEFLVSGDIEAPVESTNLLDLEVGGEKDVQTNEIGVEKQVVDVGIVAIDKGNIGDLNAQNFMVTKDINSSSKGSEITNTEKVGQKDVLCYTNGVEKQVEDVGKDAIHKGNLGDLCSQDSMDIKSSVGSSKITGFEVDVKKDVLLHQNGVDKQVIDADTVTSDQGRLNDLNIHSVKVPGNMQASVEKSKGTVPECVDQDVLPIEGGVEKAVLDVGTEINDKVSLVDSYVHDVVVSEDIQETVESSEGTVMECADQQDMLPTESGAEKVMVDMGTVINNELNLVDSNVHDVVVNEDIKASVESSKGTILECVNQLNTLSIEVAVNVDAVNNSEVNLVDSNVQQGVVDNEDTHASVKRNKVTALECVRKKDVVMNLSGIENNSQQMHNVTEKENARDKCQGQGTAGCKNVFGPKNEVSCNEYDASRPPLGPMNQVCSSECIDGSRAFDTLVGDETSGRELPL